MAVNLPAERTAWIITAGPILVDIAGHCASLDGQELYLTRTEFDLLAYFVRHPGRVLSRAELRDAVQFGAYSPSERTIDAHVKNLRAKLGDKGRHSRLIQTVYGVGYKLLHEPARNSA